MFDSCKEICFHILLSIFYYFAVVQEHLHLNNWKYYNTVLSLHESGMVLKAIHIGRKTCIKGHACHSLARFRYICPLQYLRTYVYITNVVKVRKYDLYIRLCWRLLLVIFIAQCVIQCDFMKSK